MHFRLVGDKVKNLGLFHPHFFVFTTCSVFLFLGNFFNVAKVAIIHRKQAPPCPFFSQFCEVSGLVIIQKRYT